MQPDAPEIRDLKRSELEIVLEVLASVLMIAIWGIATYQFRLTGQTDPGVFAVPSVFMLLHFTFLGACAFRHVITTSGFTSLKRMLAGYMERPDGLFACFIFFS